MGIISFLNISEGKKTVTLSLIAINFFLFVFINLLLGEDAIFWFTQNNALIFEEGQVWRLFTANWFHADIFHLLSNMVGLLIFGIALESAVRKWQYIVIYLCSGLIGNVSSLFLAGPYVHSLGASGCVFGVLAATFIIDRRFDPAAVVIGLVFVSFFIILSIAPQVDTWAHVFGALGGVFFGFWFSPKKPEDRFKDVY